MTVETREQFESRIRNSSMVEALKEFFLEYGPHDGMTVDENSNEYAELSRDYLFSKDSLIMKEWRFFYVFDPETRSVMSIYQGDNHREFVYDIPFREYISESR